MLTEASGSFIKAGVTVKPKPIDLLAILDALVHGIVLFAVMLTLILGWMVMR